MAGVYAATDHPNQSRTTKFSDIFGGGDSRSQKYPLQRLGIPLPAALVFTIFWTLRQFIFSLRTGLKILYIAASHKLSHHVFQF
jgi:hypothetical protein